MNKPVVLVTETLDPEAARWLSEHAEVIWCSHDAPEFPQALAQAQGLVVRTYTQVNSDLLAQAPKLVVAGRAGVGLENFDLPACSANGVRVVFTPDANTQAVVEYVLGLVLDHYRPRYTLTGHVAAATFHTLRKEQVGKQIDQMTLGILGFGRIGKRLGQVASALGINLVVSDLLPEVELRKAVNYPFAFVDKDELYASSDILTVHVDGRKENRQLIGEDAFVKMKSHCLFINAARGMLVDNAALRRWALATQSHGGAAILDVHEPEPPPTDYPLFGLPNVRLLPHLASRTNEALLNMSWVVRDVMRVLEGIDPTYPAN